MFTLRFYETRVAARKLLNDSKEEYPVYLLAAILAADKDGIDVKALKDALSSLNTAEINFKLGFDND